MVEGLVFLRLLVPFLLFSWSFLGMVSSSSPVVGVFWFLLASFPLWVFLGVLVLSFLRFLFGSRSCVRSWLFRRFRSFLLGPLRSVFSFLWLECASSLSVSSLVFWSVFGGSPSLLFFRLFGSVSFFSFPCRLSESPVSVVTFLLLSYGSSWNGFPSESRCVR